MERKKREILLKYRTRGLINKEDSTSGRGEDNTRLRDLPRVYFSCHLDDFEYYFDRITKYVFKILNCAVYYLPEELQKDFSEKESEELEQLMNHMQLMIVPITQKYFCEKSVALDYELSIAKKNNLLIIPILCDQNLDGLFMEYFDKRQYIRYPKLITDPTEISFEEKLRTNLLRSLVDDEMVEKIKKCFVKSIFISYRKMDRYYAQRVIKYIHDQPGCEGISIWYDEFLVAGESYEKGIDDALSSCDLVTLVVTPNLLKPASDGKSSDNYVMKVEYPIARETLKKNIMPVEMVETDRKKLERAYKEIKPCIFPETSLKEMDEYLTELITEPTDDLEYCFYLGLAYQNGIRVEKDCERACKLLEEAAQNGVEPAAERLVTIYANGEGVPADYDRAIYYQEKIVEARKTQKKMDEYMQDSFFLIDLCARNCDEDKVRELFQILLSEMKEYASGLSPLGMDDNQELRESYKQIVGWITYIQEYGERNFGDKIDGYGEILEDQSWVTQTFKTERESWFSNADIKDILDICVKKVIDTERLDLCVKEPADVEVMLAIALAYTENNILEQFEEENGISAYDIIFYIVDESKKHQEKIGAYVLKAYERTIGEYERYQEWKQQREETPKVVEELLQDEQSLVLELFDKNKEKTEQGINDEGLVLLDWKIDVMKRLAMYYIEYGEMEYFEAKMKDIEEAFYKCKEDCVDDFSLQVLNDQFFELYYGVCQQLSTDRDESFWEPAILNVYIELSERLEKLVLEWLQSERNIYLLAKLRLVKMLQLPILQDEQLRGDKKWIDWLKELKKLIDEQSEKALCDAQREEIYIGLNKMFEEIVPMLDEEEEELCRQIIADLKKNALMTMLQIAMKRKDPLSIACIYSHCCNFIKEYKEYKDCFLSILKESIQMIPQEKFMYEWEQYDILKHSIIQAGFTEEIIPLVSVWMEEYEFEQSEPQMEDFANIEDYVYAHGLYDQKKMRRELEK